MNTLDPVPESPVANRQRRNALTLGLLLLAGGLAARPSWAGPPPINTLKGGLFGGRTDTAINGYDTVAYFTDGKPVKGQDSLVHEWMGAKWKFSTQANLDRFKASPEKYAPQYGGYCAFGVAKGTLVKIEPDQFTVRDGKLYLNYDADVQAQWLRDPAGFIKAADARFQGLLK
jgi:YHS domain-containing protein